MKNCKECDKPLHGKREGAMYCSKACNNNGYNKTRKALNGINNANNNPNNTTISTSKPMSNTEEHLFRRELDKQDLAIAELKAIIKERESELKTLTKEHYELQLKHNTVATTHQQELNGVEQSKKNFLGDLMAVIKDKEAMDGIAGVIQSVKSGENNKALSQTESEELQAVKHFFNTLSGDDQLLLGENIFVYTKRPDLLQKHNQDLKNIVNS